MKNINPPSHHDGSSNFNGLPPAAKAELSKRSEVVLFNKKEVILTPDYYSEYVYLIYSGLIMSYVQRGDENIVNWVRGREDFAFAQNTKKAGRRLQKQFTGQIMIALERTHAMKISFESLTWLQDNWPQIDQVISSYICLYVVMDYCIQTDKNTSKDKYEFVQRKVEFDLNKVPDIYLASWLGITLVELKEIRENINNNQTPDIHEKR